MRCINYLSEYLVPVVLFYIVGFAVLQKRPVFDDFIEGALAGLKTVAGILPTLVGLMAAVGVLRTSGFLDFLSGVLAGPAAFLHIPTQVVPLLLVRLVSSSAATGLLLDVFKTYGPDSRLGMMVSVLESCTETVFYTMAVYFGAVHIKKTRYTLAGALFSSLVGMAVSIALAGLL
jgi:spore maturation protein B